MEKKQLSGISELIECVCKVFNEVGEMIRETSCITE